MLHPLYSFLSSSLSSTSSSIHNHNDRPKNIRSMHPFFDSSSSLPSSPSTNSSSINLSSSPLSSIISSLSSDNHHPEINRIHSSSSPPSSSSSISPHRLIIHRGDGSTQSIDSSQLCYDGNEIQELIEAGMPLEKAMIAGATAGVIEHVSMYPVDTIKTRMQALNPDGHQQYTSVTNAIARICREEGFTRLYRGVGAVVTAAIPSHAVHYATYEFAKHKLGANESGHRPLETALSGATATMAHDAVVTPLDVIKQRLQIVNSHYPSVASAARKIFAEEGLRGFYASYPTTVMMNIPFVSVYFTTYESTKLLLSGGNSHHVDQGLSEHLLAGGISGICAAWISTPFDVVKTRIQTQHSAIIDGIQREEAVGAIGMAKRIYHQEGYRGFLKGASARCLYFAPSAAICWTTYETLKKLLKEAW